jgi:hypothetical protein
MSKSVSFMRLVYALMEPKQLAVSIPSRLCCTMALTATSMELLVIVFTVHSMWYVLADVVELWYQVQFVAQLLADFINIIGMDCRMYKCMMHVEAFWVVSAEGICCGF